jgi:hypothetical protein
LSEQYLMHYGREGMKWGQHIFGDKQKTYSRTKVDKPPRLLGRKNKREIAEKYLGRKLNSEDGDYEYSVDGLTRKKLKNIKTWDVQEKKYNAVKKKGDPHYGYVRGYDLKYQNALTAKEVDKLIKKMSNDPELDTMAALKHAHKVRQGKDVVRQVLKNSARAMFLGY